MPPKKTSSAKKKEKGESISKTVFLKPKETPEIRVEKALLENFVSLQKVLTNLAVKLDGLSDQISKLLQLFEISAKSFTEKDFKFGEKDGEILKKVDTLLEQNKVIAKGITLMDEKLRNRRPLP